MKCDNCNKKDDRNFKNFVWLVLIFTSIFGLISSKSGFDLLYNLLPSTFDFFLKYNINLILGIIQIFFAFFSGVYLLTE